MSGLAAALSSLVDAFGNCAIPYMIGGSVASGVHGVYRTSLDVDLVVDIDSVVVPRFVRELGNAFYADADQIRDALQAGRSFNLIHLASSYKFDLFPLAGDPFQQSQFSRRVVRDLVTQGQTLSLPMATAEDTLLMKLAWYRLGGEVSERQWNDVRGILAVQRGRLDSDYLNRWALYLKVEDLFRDALESS